MKTNRVNRTIASIRDYFGPEFMRRELEEKISSTRRITMVICDWSKSSKMGNRHRLPLQGVWEGRREHASVQYGPKTEGERILRGSNFAQCRENGIQLGWGNFFEKTITMGHRPLEWLHDSLVCSTLINLMSSHHLGSCWKNLICYFLTQLNATPLIFYSI